MLAHSMLIVIETASCTYSQLALRKKQSRQFSMVSINVRRLAHNVLKRF